MPHPTLLVFSHLRWDYVWQRPQQIVSRLARRQRVVFVEEPEAGDREEVEIQVLARPDVTVVRARVPREPHLFGDATDPGYEGVLRDLCPEGDVVAWLYTPFALNLATSMSPRLLVYDVMDDLAAFKNAPPVMKTQHRAALAAADLVFTGGPSLHRGVLTHRSGDVHLFRSGVDLEHYARAARQRRPAGRRVAGYVGVLDERIDFGLVAQLAAELPDWDIELVGPVHSKIKDVVLPEATHLHYRGFASYDELPEIMALFDVAIMPFARNEATRSISPTKTMEYFAAGLPVVSTPIRDVVDDYGHVVRVAETADAFAAACRAAVDSPPGAALRPADTVLAEGSWDVIVSRMRALVDAKLRAPTAGR